MHTLIVAAAIIASWALGYLSGRMIDDIYFAARGRPTPRYYLAIPFAFSAACFAALMRYAL